MKRSIDFGQREDSEWEEFLAQLPQEMRSRFLNPDVWRIWANKAFQRRLAADLPISEKVKRLEEMIKAAELRRGSRQVAKPERLRNYSGGRSAATGVMYEVRVAAWMAAKNVSW